MKKTTFTILLVGLFMILNASAFAQSLPITGSFNSSIPTGWTYITNSPDYPNPDYYSAAGELKLNREGMGILSPVFTAQNDITVTLNISALFTNEKTGSSDVAFTISGLNEEGTSISTITIAKDDVVTGDNQVSLSGTDITQVKIILTGYPYNGSKYCNVSLASVSINAKGATSTSSVQMNNFKVYVSAGQMHIDGVKNGAVVEIYSVLGSRVMVGTIMNGNFNVSDLNKGMYIVRVGKYNQKIML